MGLVPGRAGGPSIQLVNGVVYAIVPLAHSGLFLRSWIERHIPVSGVDLPVNLHPNQIIIRVERIVTFDAIADLKVLHLLV